MLNDLVVFNSAFIPQQRFKLRPFFVDGQGVAAVGNGVGAAAEAEEEDVLSGFVVFQQEEVAAFYVLG